MNDLDETEVIVVSRCSARWFGLGVQPVFDGVAFLLKGRCAALGAAD